MVNKKGEEVSSLTISHQLMTVILLPVCTVLVSICTFFLSEIYTEYKVFKSNTQEFVQKQFTTDERQNANIKRIHLELIGILPKENDLPYPIN